MIPRAEQGVPDEKSPFDISNGHHLRRIAIPGLAYLGMGIAATQATPGSVARLALTLGLVVAFAWIMMVDLKAIRRLDELGRRIHGEAAVLALGITITTFAVFAFLPFAGVAVPRVQWTWIPPFLLTVWGLSVEWVSRRYR